MGYVLSFWVCLTQHYKDLTENTISSQSYTAWSTVFMFNIS